MYKLAPQAPFKGANLETAKISPYSSIYELETGGRYPWLGNSSTGLGVAPTSNQLAMFGKKRKNSSSKRTSKKKVGYTVNKKGNVVNVYTCVGKTGKCYYNGRKLTKSSKVYKTKTAANKASKNKTVKDKSNFLGYTKFKGKIVRVYKCKGKAGRCYSNGKKLPKGKKVYKTKASVKSRRRKKRVKHKDRYIYIDFDKISGRKRNYSNVGYRKGGPCYQRTNEGDCYSNPNCEWSNTHCKKKSGGVYEGPVNRQGFGNTYAHLRHQLDQNMKHQNEWESFDFPPTQNGSSQMSLFNQRNSLSGNLGFGKYINPANQTNYKLYQYANNSATPSVRQMRNILNNPSGPVPNFKNIGSYGGFKSSRNFSGMGF